MKKEKSITKNFIFNLSLTLLNMAFPLFIAAYVSRVLGATNLGKYNFALSVANWFILLGSFGIPSYGIREIAKVSKDKKKMDTVFTELIIIQLICTMISLFLYFFVVIINGKMRSEITLFAVTGMSLLLNVVSIDWFYQGIEEYGYVVLRSLILKVISLILVFLLVDNKDKYVLYSAINVLALSFSNILNFRNSRKFVKLKVKNINIKRHFVKLKVFFISSIVISVYTQLDQVILGVFSPSREVAFYARSKQIVSIALSFTLALSTVLIPRIAFLYENDKEKYLDVLKKSIDYIYILAIPSMLGIACLAQEIMWAFGGNEFETASNSLIIVSLTVLIVSVGTWGFNQALLPCGKEKIALKGQLVMAIISIVLNLLLIPKFGYLGASISLVVAELVGTMVGIYIIKETFKFKYITKGLIRDIKASVVMVFGILLIKSNPMMTSNLIKLIVSLLIAPVIYFICLLLLKDYIVKDILRRFFKKMIKGN